MAAVDNRDAWALISSVSRELGLGLSAETITGLSYETTSYDVMMNKLRDTPEYKRRFGVVNEQRQRQGLTILDDKTILALEKEYRETFRAFGLPTDFYDQPEDFHRFIANDISVAEVADRVQTASEMLNSKDPHLKAALKEWYGVDDSRMVAYMLDPQRALPGLQRQMNAVRVGAEAGRAGLGISGGVAESLVDAGVSVEATRQAATRTVEERPALTALAGLDDEAGLDEGQALKANLGLDAATTGRKKRLASRERARFAGSSGGTGASARAGEAGSY